jgi:Raf kinase inhibitor-like YbhB/YbcL family protein
MRLTCIAMILLGWLGFGGTAIAPQARPAEGAVTFHLSSNSFGDGQPIPVRFTCDGDDISPDLHWSGAPAGTRSFVLIVDDPDASRGPWVHWVLYDLPAGTTSLPSRPRSKEAPAVGQQGQNSFRQTGYNGPCPPAGPAHHYIFHLYALSVEHLDLPKDAGRDQVDQAMREKVLGEAKLTGTYQRQR